MCCSRRVSLIADDIACSNWLSPVKMRPWQVCFKEHWAPFAREATNYHQRYVNNFPMDNPVPFHTSSRSDTSITRCFYHDLSTFYNFFLISYHQKIEMPLINFPMEMPVLFRTWSAFHISITTGFIITFQMSIHTRFLKSHSNQKENRNTMKKIVTNNPSSSKPAT